MSSIVIDTGCLGNLADYADVGRKGAANKISDYWNKLNDKVVKKIDSYGGSHNSNVNGARSNTVQYNNQLASLYDSFKQFAANVRDLKEKAEEHESKVIGTINADLRAFCKKHDLEYKEMQEKPGFWAGLWNSICKTFHDWKDRWDSFKERFKDWFHYDGGKEIIEGVFAVVLAIVAIVVAILAFPATLALLTGATILGAICAICVIVASATLIVLSVLNAAVQLGHAIEAVNAACDDRYFDAAWETKKRNEASFSEFLRDQGMYDLANTIDIIDTVCTVITLIYDVSKFLTKASNWVKGFSFKGFVGDFWKNTKDFFKSGPGGWLFGADYDGHFFGGKPLDVMKRVQTVLTVANTTYNMVSYHDATHHKDGWTKTMDQLNNAKPVIDIITSNYKDKAFTQRHDIVTDPKSEHTVIEKKGVDANGNPVTITETKQDVIDATTGKPVGTRTTTTETNTDGSSRTTTTTTYSYASDNRGSGETKTITEVSTTHTDGSKDSLKTTETTKTQVGDRVHKTENVTKTNETVSTHEGADGYKRTSTTTDKTTTSSVNTGYGKGSDSKSTAHTDKVNIKNADGTSYSSTTSKETSVSHTKNTATTGSGTKTEASMTHNSSESRVYSTGEGNKYATSSKSDMHTASMKKGTDGKASLSTGTETKSTTVGTDGKGKTTTDVHSTYKNENGGRTQYDKTNTNSVREKAPTATTPKDTSRPVDKEWNGALSKKKPEVVGDQVNKVGQPSLRKTINSYNKAGEKINQTWKTVNQVNNPVHPAEGTDGHGPIYTTKDIKGDAGKIINGFVESTSTTKKITNAMDWIKSHQGDDGNN